MPLESRNASGYIIAFDNTGGTATGIAVNAVSKAQVNIPVTVRDDTGAQIATDTLSLAANGHLAFTLASRNIRPPPTFAAPSSSIRPPARRSARWGFASPPVAAHTYTTLPALAK